MNHNLWPICFFVFSCRDLNMRQIYSSHNTGSIERKQYRFIYFYMMHKFYNFKNKSFV